MPNRWGLLDLGYVITDYLPVLSTAEQDALLAEACAAWAAVANIRFYPTTPELANLKFFRYDSFPNNAYAVSGQPTADNFTNAGDAALNSYYNTRDYTWTAALFRHVVAHEIGHMLGLDHSSVPTALMYPNPNASDNPQANDDIPKIVALYGEPTGPLMSLIIQDHCTDTNGTRLNLHVMDLGPGWIEAQGVWEIFGNKIHLLTDAGDSQDVAVFEAGVADCTYQGTLTVHGASEAGLIFNFIDNSNYDIWSISIGAGTSSVYKKVAGTFTLLQTASSGLTNVNPEDIVMKVTTAGDNFKLYINGGLWADLTEVGRANKTGTKFGVRVYGLTGGGALDNGSEFDEITVDAVAATGVTEPWLKAVGTASILQGPAGFGTAPYLYQVQRAPNVAGVPGSWTNVSTPQTTGGTPTEFIDNTLTALNDWFRVHITDSAGSPVSMDSTPVQIGRYVSSASGVWESSATWHGHSPPSARALISTGNSVTINSNLVLGTSPSNRTTYDLEIAGSLLVKLGWSLTMRGNILTAGGGFFNIGEAGVGGAFFMWDSHLASDPTTRYIHWTTGSIDAFNNILTIGKFIIDGTAGSHSYISSHASGGNGTFGTNVPQAITFDGNFCNFSIQHAHFLRIGQVNGDVMLNPWGQSKLSSIMHDVVFDTCGCISWQASFLPDTYWDFDKITSQNCTTGDTYFILMPTNAGTPTAGLRRITNCIFDGLLDIRSLLCVCTDNMFFDHIIGDTTAGWAGVYERNWMRLRRADNELSRGTHWNDNYLFHDASILDPYLPVYITENVEFNPHWTNGNGYNSLCEYCIFEDVQSADDGDIDLHDDIPGVTSTFKHCIAFSQTGNNAGTITVAGAGDPPGSGGANHVMEHCTWMTAQVGAISLGETGAGFAGIISSMKSNICFQLPERRPGLGAPTDYTHFIGKYSAIANDCGFPADLDYNCGWMNHPDYDIPFSSGTPGVHDINVDPLFVDPRRTTATWCATLDPFWTGNPTPTRNDYNARALGKMRLVNDPTHPDYDPRFTVANLKAYIRAGFAPRNLLLKDTGHDGVTRGAVEWTAAGVDLALPVFQLQAQLSSGNFSGGANLFLNVPALREVCVPLTVQAGANVPLIPLAFQMPVLALVLPAGLSPVSLPLLPFQFQATPLPLQVQAGVNLVVPVFPLQLTELEFHFAVTVNVGLIPFLLDWKPGTWHITIGPQAFPFLALQIHLNRPGLVNTQTDQQWEWQEPLGLDPEELPQVIPEPFYVSRTNSLLVNLQEQEAAFLGAVISVEILDNSTAANGAIANSAVTLTNHNDGSYQGDFPLLSLDRNRLYLLHILVTVSGNAVVDELWELETI